jgi:hypothetical protein
MPTAPARLKGAATHGCRNRMLEMRLMSRRFFKGLPGG